MYCQGEIFPQFSVVFAVPKIQSSPHPENLNARLGMNLRRLMARFNMTLSDVVEASNLDERTIRGILQNASRPHARTLHKLAEGLAISTDELFQDPHLIMSNGDSAALFDRITNPVVADVINAHPQLFERWTNAEYDELYSRVAVGGELTSGGVYAAAAAMNDRRELMYEFSVILESHEADLMRNFVKLLFQRVTEVS